MASRASWWARKARQVERHLRARVDPEEREALEGWTAPGELALFDRMHVADRRHGLDVVATLRSARVTDRDTLAAGLLHDVGKGDTGLLPRIVWSLGEAHGPWVWRAARALPGFGPALDRLRDHPAESARLAAAAGCSPRTVALIAGLADPADARYVELLHTADEAN
jgi:hypothetical protein